ncbi:hypothetical protein A2W14_06295 [Candidatus Gottesmanbacteria bacterium RBG_16_37_8]|uniref:Glycosyltransferase RgtA/B/C/D-like domain-containing protein n=1 Tax=Candidatus Gottesmanbacteria bacterium RBG_16_37_8 TaxID=1798371 RepID=A0A1F5YWL6_9BACT|nr:MAG: hypothetical protein A2W14_06295 [Candidatus Gottesmanbacteria bacterium RBG_16_37_8]
MKMKLTIFSLCLFFTLISFIPSIYELINRDKIAPDRYFVLEHNYNFDYNFYLSRIREGTSGRWLVTEKYYNQPHKSSLFQAIYLYFGKIGKIFGLSVEGIYHAARFISGFILLLATAFYGRRFFGNKIIILFFLLTVTSSSWPILQRLGGFYRFATYMGYWSVIDSLQRITIMPHILIGQILLVVILERLGVSLKLSLSESFLLGILGLAAGIIFPPTVIISYVFIGVYGLFVVLDILSSGNSFSGKRKLFLNFVKERFLPLFIYVVLSLPSFLYLSAMLKVQPWKALALFDIEHRIPIPYIEYFLALGPILILGLLGVVWAFIKNNKQYYGPIAWIASIFLLFLIFENIPQQSPSRFTEGAIHIPLGIVATYLIAALWKSAEKLKKGLGRWVRIGLAVTTGGTIILGALVMLSMILWLTDQAYAKRLATWPVPLGAQLAYPLDDFMDGIFYLRDKTPQESVVLTYITSGNFIPAFADNYVYIGHANTPAESEKEEIAASFFKGEMSEEYVLKFLKKERISYIYYGPQERALGGPVDLREKYNFLSSVYSNKQVAVYKY